MPHTFIRHLVLLPCLVFSAGAFALAVDEADRASEPTHAECLAAVDRSRALAQALPEGDLSRYFAERNLQQALTEAGNGEFDDCMEWAEQAAVEVLERRHQLAPGETLEIMKADR